MSEISDCNNFLLQCLLYPLPYDKHETLFYFYSISLNNKN